MNNKKNILVSINMDNETIKLIDEIAKSDNRNRSNFIYNEMKKIVIAYKNKMENNNNGK